MNENALFDSISAKVTLTLEYKGREILNEKIFKLLSLIKEKGSIYAASRSLGIPYSRAWEWITKLERNLGVEVIERRRGGSRGGGTSLTSYGRRLLELYIEKLREYKLDLSMKSLLLKNALEPDIIYVGSHDPLIEIILSTFSRSNGFSVEFVRVGSCSGLLAIMIEEADLSAIHLVDPLTNEYNLPYLRRYGIEKNVVVLKGYEREMCLAYHPSLNLSSFEDAISKGYRIVNRNIGSGTRILLDYILDKIAVKLGREPESLKDNLEGYEFEVKTHDDVAKAISSGKADFGLLPRFIAMNYGLKCIHLIWERYDLVIPKRKRNKDPIKRFINFMKNKSVLKLINGMVGYRCDQELGNVIEL